MASLVTIMLSMLGLAWQAGVARHHSRPAAHHRLRSAAAQLNDEHRVLDACARASVLVFISLLGLLALGVMYGNVLGFNQVPQAP